MHIGFLILSFSTLEFWPYIYFYKHWNSYLLLALKTLEFWSYFCKHWNSHLILPNIGILALFKLYTCISTGIMTLSSFLSKHWNPGPVYTCISTGILVLSSFPSKHWNPGPVWFLCPIYTCMMYQHWNYDLIIFSLQTLESWPCLFLYTLELLSYPSEHWNPGPIIYLYYTLEFWPHPFKHWNSGPVFIITGILALF